MSFMSDASYIVMSGHMSSSSPLTWTKRWLAANLRRNGATFFGAPGVHSFYLWAEEEPPVPSYWHMWMLLYDDRRQEHRAARASARG